MKQPINYPRLVRGAAAVVLALTLAPASLAQDASQGKAVVPDKSWDCGMPGGIPSPEGGKLLFEATLPLDEVYDVGQTQYGQRKAYVGKEGEFTGEKISGKILPGAIDFDLTLSNGVVEVEQVIVMQTSDGTPVFARNGGVGADKDDVRVVFNFEAPNSSQYAWLHEGSFVARRKVDADAKTITLAVYDVTDAAKSIDKDAAIKIEKPSDAPSQSWAYRVADASESNGEQLIRETVALGRFVSIGPTRRGSRNIIPITGGTVEGKINGKVISAGADFQNPGGDAGIDARYLWQADNGEIIVVRNAGSGRLVPTFEAKVDGEYAWLNSGKYLSSPPGMGQGGVGLTFYYSK